MISVGGKMLKKKIKWLVSVLFLFTLSLSFLLQPKVAYADIGPKPASFITIKGVEGEYVACFAAKSASGPNYDYERYLAWQEDGYVPFEYNPIMEYKDADGFKWITRYYKCEGETEISFTYYCPSEYKIVIYQNGELLIATKPLEMYAFSTYYEIDFSNATVTTPEQIQVTNSYDYWGEILNLLLRIVLTLGIEIGLFYLFRLYTKRNFIVVLTVNLITQIFLNVAVNVASFTSGALSAILLLFALEFVILIVEFIAYQILFKDKKRWKILLYPLLANALSFACGFMIFGFM